MELRAPRNGRQVQKNWEGSVAIDCNFDKW